MIKNTVLIAFLVFALFAPCANGENMAEGTGTAISSPNGAAPVRLAQAQQSGASEQDWKPGLKSDRIPQGQPQNPGAQPAIPPQNLTPTNDGMGNMAGMGRMGAMSNTGAVSGSSTGAQQQNTMPMMGSGMGMGMGRMGRMGGMNSMGMGMGRGMGRMGGMNMGVASGTSTGQNMMPMMGAGMGGSGMGCMMGGMGMGMGNMPGMGNTIGTTGTTGADSGK